MKGGRYLLIDGEWYLKTRDGVQPIAASPLDEVWLAAPDLHDDIGELAETAYNPFVIPVLVFPDMEPDEAIRKLARRKGVHLVWRTDDLMADLMAIVRRRGVPASLTMERIGREVYAVTDGLIQLAEAGRAETVREEPRAKAVRSDCLVPVGGRSQRAAGQGLGRCACGSGLASALGRPESSGYRSRGWGLLPRGRPSSARRWHGWPPALSLLAMRRARHLSHPNSIDKPNQEKTNMNHTLGVAPAILRRHPGLDRGQLELIGHLEGPTLGIAGPGVGKTLAVALRGTNILLQVRARPEELVLCTYSRAAARELRQRFIALATAAGCRGDLSRVRIGTIHGLWPPYPALPRRARRSAA